MQLPRALGRAHRRRFQIGALPPARRGRLPAYWRRKCLRKAAADVSGGKMDRSILDGYDPQGLYCEMLRSSASHVIRERLSALSIDALKVRAAAANAELYNLGITFTIYSDAQTIDRILPFDVLPRILSADEWRHIERGIIQRITAINLLLDDVYHDQHLLRDGVVPA